MYSTPNPSAPGQDEVFLGFLPLEYLPNFIFIMGLEILSLFFLTPIMIFILASYYPAVAENRRGRLIFAVLFSIFAGILAPPLSIILSFPLGIICLIDSFLLRRVIKKMRREGMNPDQRLQEQTTMSAVLARYARNTGRTLWGEGAGSAQPPSYSNLSLPLQNRAGTQNGAQGRPHNCQCGPARNPNNMDLEAQGREFGRGTTCHCHGMEDLDLPAYPNPAYLR